MSADLRAVGKRLPNLVSSVARIQRERRTIMNSESTVLDLVEETDNKPTYKTLLERATEAIEAEEHFLAAQHNPTSEKCFRLAIRAERIEAEEDLLRQLLHHHKIEPADELAFRIARRAEWRAFEGVKELHDYINDFPAYVEGLRAAAEHNPERAKRLAELMRKITT
jgi:Sec-independent protein translocase protein TatA